ncbi:MAG: hypothetical protein ACOZCP_00470, partial [Pseudomonadota bacterium]
HRAPGQAAQAAMKRAKQKVRTFRPRNPLALEPLLAKGGAHERRDKRASRARQKARLRRELKEQDQ